MGEIQEIKTKLEARLRELDKRAQEIDDELSEPGDDDWTESAVESENDEVLEEIGNLAVDEIQKIRAALSKIDAGTYGICASCGRKIALKRLEALPYATTCIDCA
ncbi:MAG: TraR/DksA family transcriptional regulator [Alphaproteobacteria bacterium]|nr:TraR/DksA family transcriptional regulator [Alphaproteobacteria bacterium]